MGSHAKHICMVWPGRGNEVPLALFRIRYHEMRTAESWYKGGHGQAQAALKYECELEPIGIILSC